MVDINLHKQWLDHSPDAMLVVNHHGAIVYANAAASELLHYEAGQLLGESIEMLVPQEVRSHHGSLVQLFFESRGKRRMRNRIRVVANQGEMIDAEIQLAIVKTTPTPEAIVSIRDTTLLAETEKRLMQAELDYHQIFEISSVPMCKVSLGGRFIKVNDKLCSLFGYKRDRLLDMSFQDITHPQDLNRDMELLNEVLQGERSDYQMEKRYLCSDGRELWCGLTVSLIRDEMGFPDYFISVIQDISSKKAATIQLREFNEQLKTLVKTDHLTQVHNRQALIEELERHCAIYARHQRPASIVFIDLNNFKQINDQYGHACGDKALMGFAQSVQHHLRDSDLIARYAGDEFVILLPETAIDDAYLAVEKLKNINLSIDHDGHTVAIHFSTGVASIAEVSSGRTEDWLALADERMYADKEVN